MLGPDAKQAGRYGETIRLALLGLGACAVALVIGDQSWIRLAALVVFGVLCVITLRYPLVALSLLIIMTVTNLSPNLIVAFGAPSIAKLAVPGLLALLAVRFFFWGDRPYFGWLSIWLLCGLLALKFLGVTYAASDWQKTLTGVSDFSKDAAVALLALAFMAYRNGYETVVASAVLPIALICGLGLMQTLGVALPPDFEIFARFSIYDDRFTGPIEDGNFFAVVVVFCIPLALARLLEGRGPAEFVIWGLACCLLFYGLIATQSRGGLVSLMVAVAVLFTQLRRQQKIGAIVAGLAVVMAGSYFIADEALERLSTLFDLVGKQQIDVSTEGRLASWAVASEIFKTYTWWGVGSENFNLLYQDIALEKGLIFRGEGRSTHSLYLEFLTEQGLVGLLYFLGILGAAGYGLVRANRLAQAIGDRRQALLFAAFGAGLLGYLFGMIFLHDAYPRFLWIVIVLGIEAGRVLERRAAAPDGEGAMPSPPHGSDPDGTGNVTPLSSKRRPRSIIPRSPFLLTRSMRVN